MAVGRWSLLRRALALAAALAVCTTVLLVAPPTPEATAAVPSGFRDFTVFRGLNQPTSVAFSPDGRVFVAEKSGLIRVFDSVDDPTPSIFADLRTRVHNWWDRGLLGLALHPDFPQNPGVYVAYSYDGDIGGRAPKYGAAGATDDPCPVGDCIISGRVSRLTARGNVAFGERVLVHDWCQQFPSHSVGTLRFGPEGALYASGGDGASFNGVDYGQFGNPCGDPADEGGALRSEDLRSAGDPVGLAGTVIRIDPTTGEGLPDNPMAASPDANQRRIIAYGLRNPFRFTVRPGTEQLFVGEVGWTVHEEVNRIADPNDGVVENFGWPCYEGPGRQPGYDGADRPLCENLYAAGPTAHFPPFVSWSHNAEVTPGDGCGVGSSSASGVAFYPGGSYPDTYDGSLFFADYSRRCIWSVPRGPSGDPDPAQRRPFVTGAAGPVELVPGPGGDLYYVAINDGTIHRIGYSAGNQPPLAVVNANPTSGAAPLTVTFSGTSSSDPDPGDTLSYEWDLDGDGALDDSTSATPTFTYTANGPVTVRLRVRDALGAASETSQMISVGTTAPVPTIATPAPEATFAVGSTLSFSGSATDPQDGALPPSALRWSAVLYHCSAPTVCHRHPAFYTGTGASGSFPMPDHERIAYVELTLTATAGGESVSTTRTLGYRTTDMTFTSDPPGVGLTVGSSGEASPFTRTLPAGGRISVSAPETATIDGQLYTFAGWSDGAARVHDVVVPAAPATLTARYTRTGGTVTFLDDFEDGNADGWQVHEGDWTICRPPGGSLEYCADGAGPGWLSLAGDPSWRDYSVDSAVRMPVNAGGGAVLIGRAQDPLHYYQLELKRDPGTGERRWWIWRREGWTWTPIASGPFAYNANQWYHLRLTMRGAQLTASISSDHGNTYVPMGGGTDATWASGRIGVHAWGDPASFDVVTVRGV